MRLNKIILFCLPVVLLLALATTASTDTITKTPRETTPATTAHYDSNDNYSYNHRHCDSNHNYSYNHRHYDSNDNYSCNHIH